MKSLAQDRSFWLSVPAAERRKFVVVANVLLFHALALWALQSGLLRRAVELVVPVQMLSEFVEPPAPRVAPPVPAVTARKPVAQPKAPSQPAAQQPLARQDDSASPSNWVVQAAPAMPAAIVAAPVVQAAPASAPSVELPNNDADYLQNPKPPYPAASKRRGEQGLVIHSVLIGADGLPQSAKLVKSSGFDALDQAALAAVMRWRYVPGKRNGLPTAMSFNVPVDWVLK